jgi:hypothetical protein
MADGKGKRADPDTLNTVYGALLARLHLDLPHRAKLMGERHLSADLTATINEKLQYRSLGAGRAKAAHGLVESGLEKLLPTVPGFFVQDKPDGSRYWTVAGGSGILVPIRDKERRIVALVVRLDAEHTSGKYRYLSSKRRGGPGPGAPVHVPLFDGDTSKVRVTEGALKADVATLLSGMLTIGLPGVASWRRAAPVLRELAAKVVRLAFDADAWTNRAVALALARLAEHLFAEGFTVELEQWDAADSKGIDDLLATGKISEVVPGESALTLIRQMVENTAGQASPVVGGNDRPTIIITTDEHLVNAEAAAALARDLALYQRGGLLVRIVRDESPAAHGIRRPLAPRIEAQPQALLRERLAANARWVDIRETKEGPVERAARPPAWCVAAVHARADWPGVRYLEAVVDCPVLRPDGTILDQLGYDGATGLLLDFKGEPPAVPPVPSHREARAACNALLEVVADFPFAAECHRGAWLAALLTPLARFAFVGPAPLFLVDSNVRGSGKGLLLDCISRIVTGERFTVATYTSDEDELRKRITSLALAGDRLVLFDNLEGRFGNATLDAALTATSWEDRVLGVNRMARAPLFVTWYATGNNVAVGADTARRVCHVRLESPEERPEERSNFRHADLLGYVAAERPRLLGAALTILRAYCAAGWPQQELRPWGSFDGWSRLVRSAVVWVGLPDPGETRYLLQVQADVTAEAMSLLLACWERMDPDCRGLTAAEVVDRLFKRPQESPPDWHADMRSAVETLAGRGDSRALGNKLRSYRRRIFSGRFIDQAGTQHRAARWVVLPASDFGRSGEKDSPHSPDSPPIGVAIEGRTGECGECGESFSANGPSPNGQNEGQTKATDGMDWIPWQ